MTFDPARVSYADLLRIFFSVALDPTQLDRQGPDWGAQYRSELFVDGPEQDRVAHAYVAQLDAAHVFDKPIATSVDSVGQNAALEALEALRGEYAVMRRTDLLPLDEAERDHVQRLAADLPALWHATTTTMVDRKRLLRLVVTEVTLTTLPEQRQAAFKVLWCGGAVTLYTADCPPIGAHQRTEARVLARLAALAGDQPDHRVAARLNAEGLRTRTGKEWSYARVHSMRKQHGIPTGCPLKPDPAAARAERLQVSPSLVNLWVRHGVLEHDQRVQASKVWVRLTEQDFARLTGACPEATDLPTFRSIMRRTGLSPKELWEQVSAGC